MEYLWWIAGALVLIQVVFKDIPRFARFLPRKAERQRSIAHASNGVYMLFIVGAVVYQHGPLFFLDNWQLPITAWRFWAGGIGVPILFIWGLGWMIPGIGYRSRGVRDGELLFSYGVKIVCGVGLAYWAENYAPSWAYLPLAFVGTWLLITGVVSFALVMRHPAGWREPGPVEGHAVYGKARFADIQGKK